MLMWCQSLRARRNRTESQRDGSAYRVWHSQFLDCFTAAASSPDRARHHFATFVLANYTDISSRMGGGLSGAFLPIPPGFSSSDPAVSVSCWGRHKTEPKPHNGWSEPDDQALTWWSSRGFVAGLDPFACKAEHGARVLSFDVHRLPLEVSLWRTEPSLVAWEITDCTIKPTDAIVLSAEAYMSDTIQDIHLKEFYTRPLHWLVVHHLLSADLLRELASAIIQVSTEGKLGLHDLFEDIAPSGPPATSNWFIAARETTSPFAYFLSRLIMTMVWQGDDLAEPTARRC